MSSSERRIDLKAMQRERERLADELARSLQLRATGSARMEQDQERAYHRLQRLDALHTRLQHQRAQRRAAVIIALLIMAGGMLVWMRVPVTPFQMEGRFSSILFRTTGDLNIKLEERAPWVRNVRRVMVDDSWSRLDDGPFPIREAVDVESYNDKPLQFSHLLIPAGTTVRMQRDGNLWSWILQPRPERSRDLQITIYKPDGAMGHTGGKATAFAEGLSLTAVDSTPQVLRMAGLQLELPCLAVDSIRFVNTDYLHPDLTVGSSVMEAKLAARSGGDGARHLLQHDTLALGLEGAAILCLAADSAGLRAKLTGEAHSLIAGGAGDGAKDCRPSMWSRLYASIPSDVRAFLFSVFLAVAGFYFLNQRRS